MTTAQKSKKVNLRTAWTPAVLNWIRCIICDLIWSAPWSQIVHTEADGIATYLTYIESSLYSSTKRAFVRAGLQTAQQWFKRFEVRIVLCANGCRDITDFIWQLSTLARSPTDRFFLLEQRDRQQLVRSRCHLFESDIITIDLDISCGLVRQLLARF